MTERRFPPRWSGDAIGADFVVKDGNEQQLADACIRGSDLNAVLILLRFAIQPCLPDWWTAACPRPFDCPARKLRPRV
jgi:hypothetical protein